MLPIDPDIDPEEDAPHRPGRAPRDRPAGWPRFHPTGLLLVFAGGCLGGLLRYAVTRHWPVGVGAFPYPTLAVNVAGAFVLAVLLVFVTTRSQTAHARLFAGTGFCGALTTFSSVVVDSDRLVAHGRSGVAAAYLLVTIFAGLAAVLLGVTSARVVWPRPADAEGDPRW